MSQTNNVAPYDHQRGIHPWRYCAATILPIILLSTAIFFLIAQRFDEVRVSEDKMAGIKVISGINHAITSLQKVRGLWQIRLQGGGESISSRIEAQQVELGSALSSLIEDQGVARLTLQNPLRTLRDELRTFSNWGLKPQSADKLFKSQSEVVSRLLELMQLAAIRSSLVLDSKSETYHLMELVVKGLPEAAESIGRLRGIASGYALKEYVTETEYLLLQGYRARLKQELNNLLRSHQASLTVLTKNKAYSTLDVTGFISAAQDFDQDIMTLFKAAVRTGDELRIFVSATKLLDLNINLHQEAMSQLIVLLKQRVSSLRHVITTSIVLAILVSLLMGYFVYGFYRSNHQMLKQLLQGIEDRKRAEVALRHGELRNRATINAALDGIVTIDKNGSVIEFNPSAEKIFSYRNEDVLGKDIAELIIPPAFRDRHRAGLKRYCDTGQSMIVGKHVELKAMCSDGVEFPIELTISPVEHSGEMIFTAFIRDVTERNQLQQQLQQAQKMESIGQLTGGIAHDFNNMLTSILGFAELARQGLGLYDDKKIEAYLSKILTSGARARDLIDQMLAFSRGGEGELKPVQLFPMIEDSLKMLSPTLPSSIEIDLRIEDEGLITATDSVQFHQLLMNLCINSRDAMNGKGNITIGLRRINGLEANCCSCRERIRGDYIEVSVRDSGGGIKPEQLDYVFEPFYTTKEVGKGTGMGLPMVHGIMHGHGGHVVVETVPGKSCNFSLMFPMIDVDSDSLTLQ